MQLHYSIHFLPFPSPEADTQHIESSPVQIQNLLMKPIEFLYNLPAYLMLVYFQQINRFSTGTSLNDHPINCSIKLNLKLCC